MLIVNSPISKNISLHTHLINYNFSFISYFISKTVQYFGTSCMSYQNIIFMHIYCHATGDCTMDIQDLCFKTPVYLLHSNQSNHHWIKTFYFLLPPTSKSSISIRWTASFRKWHILSVDKKNQLVVTFVFFISLLLVAQHVSGNHVPIIRSWRLRDVIASCWYCAVAAGRLSWPVSR